MQRSDRIAAIVDSSAFRNTVITLILLNAVIIGLETYPEMRALYGVVLHRTDRAILYLFTVELALRLFASSPKREFFRSGWNLFDLLVVGAGYLPASAFFTVVRLFRVLRILRAITVLPNLQKLVAALIRSLSSLGHIVLLIGLLMYIYAAIGTFLYAEIAPHLFGTLHESFLTLFTVLTLEGWPDVMREVLAHAPYAWIYFASYLLFGTYVALNFFVGVIVNNLASDVDDPNRELRELRAVVERIEARLAQADRGAGEIASKRRGR